MNEFILGFKNHFKLFIPALTIFIIILILIWIGSL